MTGFVQPSCTPTLFQTMLDFQGKTMNFADQFETYSPLYPKVLHYEANNCVISIGNMNCKMCSLVLTRLSQIWIADQKVAHYPGTLSLITFPPCKTTCTQQTECCIILYLQKFCKRHPKMKQIQQHTCQYNLTLNIHVTNKIIKDDKYPWLNKDDKRWNM